MKRLVAPLLAGGLLAGLIACSPDASDRSRPCPLDRSAFLALEDRARSNEPVGHTARSALQYLARQNLPTSGYHISKKPLASGNGKVEYELRHEDGFDKPCGRGNPSGFDGVLEVDPASREVKRFVIR